MERFQLFGLVTLGRHRASPSRSTGCSSPAARPGPARQGEAQLAKWGAELFAPTAEGGFNCAGCHGGMKATGGAAPYTITDKNTGAVRPVTWNAPALNTVLYRFSEEEVRFILVYGRQFSPMSPWGIAGGGPMNDQQITSIIAYLKSIQLPAEACPAGANLCEGGRLPADKQAEIQKAIDDAVANGTAEQRGRGHLQPHARLGRVLLRPLPHQRLVVRQPVGHRAAAPSGPTSPAAPRCASSRTRRTTSSFVQAPPEHGKQYGQQGQSSGRMPGFGMYYTAQQLAELVKYIRSL